MVCFENEGKSNLGRIHCCQAQPRASELATAQIQWDVSGKKVLHKIENHIENRFHHDTPLCMFCYFCKSSFMRQGSLWRPALRGQVLKVWVRPTKILTHDKPPSETRTFACQDFQYSMYMRLSKQSKSGWLSAFACLEGLEIPAWAA